VVLPDQWNVSVRWKDRTGMVINAQTAPAEDGTPRWWPSKYGADDQADALNEFTSAKVLQAFPPGPPGTGAGNEPYASGEPGPGLALGRWLADHRVALTRCDTWSFGPTCRKATASRSPSRRRSTSATGVVVENLRLDQAARERVHEFLLVISHAKLRGATGAWVAPLAIV
jgi:hypothetical protein